MRAFLFTLLTLPAVSAFADGEPVPTVIVDIHALGAERVEALKRAPGVTWSAEFGNEMLLGVSPQSLNDVLKNQRARPGPAALAFDEVVVRDHACTVHDHETAIAVVGGYEILRKSPTLARATLGEAAAGEPLPIDGVVAREVRNEHVQKGAAPPVTEVQNLVARVDGDRWHDTMSALATFNRNSFNPGLIQSHDWILQRFADIGLDTQSFAFTMSASASSCGQTTAPPSRTAYNPIGIKRGQSLPDEWIIVGAHYDSRNGVRCESSATPAPQPGANDNASGCAGVMELAQVFSTMSTRRSILFMCFAGEEQGLLGSLRYRDSLMTSGDISRVKHMINLDMIGHAIDDSLSARVETTNAHIGVLSLYADAAATYAPELNLITTDVTQAYSDHWYFLQAGIPGAFTWENGAGIYNPHYHASTDVPANMQRARPLAKGILKMDTAVLASVAGLLPLFADSFGD